MLYEVITISGTDAPRLEASLRPFREGDTRWEPIDTGLEEVFIHLMRRAGAS